MKGIKKTLCTIVLASSIGLATACGGDSSVPNPEGTSIGLQVSAASFRGSAIAAADFDGDGDIDILATNKNGEVFLYTNTGDGYSKSIKPLLKVSSASFRGSAIAAADFDGDGDIDILATDGNGNLYLYENKGNNQY